MEERFTQPRGQKRKSTHPTHEHELVLSEELCARRRHNEQPTSDRVEGRYQNGCTCERCKRLVEYHSNMNNDVMVAPETAYIVGAFFKDWKLPRADFALTAQDIPQNEALEHIKEASLRFDRRTS